MSKLKTACVWLVIPFSLSAAGFDTEKVLTGIEDRYNHIQTLQVDFVQTYKFRGPTRIPEKGTLYLHKPGRMRWEYSSPEGKLFISDGKLYYDYTPEDKTGKRTKMKDDDDLRGPLAFLLGKLNFHEDFGKYDAKQQRRGRRDHGVSEKRPGSVCGSILRGRCGLHDQGTHGKRAGRRHHALCVFRREEEPSRCRHDVPF